MDERTSIRILDNNTLAEIGVAYDLMNTRVYQQINDKYTLDFNILPYTDVNKIMFPNLLELDNEYWQVRRVQKVRNSTLMMTINCEQIAYELNEPLPEDEEMEELVYEGTPTEILNEMLQGSRFNIGTVHSTDAVTFKTKTVGVRSRIIEFAKAIEAEVGWNKFSVSLLAQRGHDNGVTLEVGKNIIEMTENIELTEKRTISRSYEVEMVDLNYVTDANEVPLELYNIRLGDHLTLIDEQFSINKKNRVVAIGYDPFRRALPEIEFENTAKDITTVINSNISAAPINPSEFVLETQSATFSEGLIFNFTKPYTQVVSVVVSITSGTTSGNVNYKLITNTEGKYTGVSVHSHETLTDVTVSVQAVVK